MITEPLLILIYEHLTSGVVGLSVTGKVTFANPAALNKLQFSTNELVGQHLHDKMQDKDAEGHLYSWRDSPIGFAARSREPYAADNEFFHTDEVEFPVSYRCIPVPGAEETALILMFDDITTTRMAGNFMRHVANHDPLTGLGGRLMFNTLLTKSVAQANRRQTPLAVLYLDLNGFKAVNDTHGHAMGDKLLQEAARRIELALRDSDTICRLGGDEFGVIASELASSGDAKRVAERIVASLEAPFEIDDTLLQVSASVGIACLPENSKIATELVEMADQAMYEAKHKHTGMYKFYRG